MVGIQIPLLLVACFAFALSIPSRPVFSSALLGAEECGHGPSYWCQSFMTARTCKAMKHCIETVWEHQVLPKDNSDVCKICKDMVKQARDQLQSNETQEELKEVFEGSCKLILVKPIVKECIKLADDFIPELIETLSSQMDPQMVCSVAGLCNSAHIAELLTSTTTQAPMPEKLKSNELDCAGCRYISGVIEEKFQKASKDDVLNMFIEICSKTSSFSDGCSAIVITYFNEIYNDLHARLRPNETCHIAGVCSPKYHIHADKLDTFSKVSKNNDDLPCDLCKQLVQHLADVLTTNTTELEFKQVLLGICGQTKSFKNECVNLVNEYYSSIYELLTKELDGEAVCRQIGICHVNGLIEGEFDTPLYPLIPTEMVSKVKELQSESTSKKPKLHHVSLSKAELPTPLTLTPVSNVEIMQLPVERLIPKSFLPHDKNTCAMCEYFLHYLQVEMTDPASELEIKRIVEQGCDKLPQSVTKDCRDFVEIYGDAFVAILAQKIDPSLVCPSIGVCPGVFKDSQEPVEVNEKPTCPLCMLSMEALFNELKDNKTEEAIRNILDDVCYTLPKTVTQDCLKFVNEYVEEIVDMIVADFTPQEICVFAKLCDPPKVIVGGDIDTNEIPDTIKDEMRDKNVCVLCEFVMTQLEKELEDKKTEAEIKQAVLSVCHLMPSTVKTQCNQFVEQYADLIIQLLATSVNPKGICTALNLCNPTPIELTSIKKAVKKCFVCEAMIGAFQGIIEDKDVDYTVNRKLAISCNNIPVKMRAACHEIVQQLAPQIETILGEIPVGPLVCRKLNLCEGNKQEVKLLGRKNCSRGPGYWCQSTTTAAECNAIEHCQTNIWMANKPKKMH